MCDADSLRRERLDVVRREPDAVCGDDVVSEKSDGIEIRGRGEAGGVVLDLRALIFRFRDVDEDRRVATPSPSARTCSRCARETV